MRTVDRRVGVAGGVALAMAAALVVPGAGRAQAAGTLDHVLVTGQSLAEGFTSGPALSTTQAYGNLMLQAEFNGDTATFPAFVPLVEGVYPYPTETIASGLADSVASRNAGVRMVVTNNAKGSSTYAQLKRGTGPYQQGLDMVAAASQLATGQGDRDIVRAVAVIHGEDDGIVGNQHYAADLVEWQHDYEADVQAITGQSEPVLLMTDQMGSFLDTSTIPMQQWAAARDHPDRIVLVGPKYFLDYGVEDHLTNRAELILGEYYAKAYERQVRQGQRWTPFAPRRLTLCDRVITARFDVPAPPIRIDTGAVVAAAHLGFQFDDRTGESPGIAGVQLADATTVTITLDATPNPAAMRLRYAATADGDRTPDRRARGNLRDTDTWTGVSGVARPNWLVHFDEPVVQSCAAADVTTGVAPVPANVPTTGRRGPIRLWARLYARLVKLGLAF